MTRLTEAQRDMLMIVCEAGGTIDTDRGSVVNGRGFAVNGSESVAHDLVKRGLLEWKHGSNPRTMRGTALLLLTTSGRAALEE